MSSLIGRCKEKLVAGGHKTETPKDECFSGVVQMESVRMGFFLAELNDLLVCAGNVGNAFLTSYTREPYYVVAGPEFGPELQGKCLLIYKSIYGLKLSAACVHEGLSKKLLAIEFCPSKADPDLWMKDMGTHYEYIARFVDDVIVFSKDPMAVMKQLMKAYVMKGVSKPQYYLGGDVVTLDEVWYMKKRY